MLELSSQEARNRWGEVLDRVEQGEDVVILRRGKRVARLLTDGVDAQAKFPSLHGFRASIQVTGEPLSETIIRMRQEER